MISARFDGGEKEQVAQELHEQLLNVGINSYMVEGGAGQQFGKQAIKGLVDMEVMIAICFDDYGQKTESKYYFPKKIVVGNKKDLAKNKAAGSITQEDIKKIDGIKIKEVR